MAFIQQERNTATRSSSVSLADRVLALEKSKKLLEREVETKEKTKEFKWPFKWVSKFKQAKRKKNDDMMLVIFLNKKNELEAPKFMPIYDGNMIIYKNKPYEFDPRAVWRVKGMKGTPQAYIIKEIDRRPVMNKFGRKVYADAAVSNMDLEEIRARGDSTESDEFLIKAALKAQQSQAKKNINIAVIAIVAIVVIGGIIWFLSSK
jgi:hypothetical protein